MGIIRALANKHSAIFDSTTQYRDTIEGLSTYALLGRKHHDHHILELNEDLTLGLHYRLSKDMLTLDTANNNFVKNVRMFFTYSDTELQQLVITANANHSGNNMLVQLLNLKLNSKTVDRIHREDSSSSQGIFCLFAMKDKVFAGGSTYDSTDGNNRATIYQIMSDQFDSFEQYYELRTVQQGSIKNSATM